MGAFFLFSVSEKYMPRVRVRVRVTNFPGRLAVKSVALGSKW